MRLGEYSKRYGLRNVTGLPNFFYVILAQYSGSRCKPMKLAVNVHGVPIQKPKLKENGVQNSKMHHGG